jgi:membrane fusion protein (multidrug efflux system)
MNKKTVNFLILGIIVAISAVVGYLYWNHNKLYPSTDDAYIEANTINIAAQVTGPVLHTYVHNLDYVKKGELLLDIDPAPFEIAVRKTAAQLTLTKQKVAGEQAEIQAATAEVAQRRHELIYARENAHRILPLVKTGRVAKTQGDEIIEKLNVAKSALQAATQNLEKAKQQLGLADDNNAEIRSAKASLAQAQLDLQHTHIVAPNTGQVINYNLRVGDMVSQGIDLFSLSEQKTWWVNANFKETQLARIRPGQATVITTDIYPAHPFEGIVTNISQGSGSAFALLPAENATGNWVKVTQRFPVRIKIIAPSTDYPLRVGASASVTINTTKSNAHITP